MVTLFAVRTDDGSSKEILLSILLNKFNLDHHSIWDLPQIISPSARSHHEDNASSERKGLSLVVVPINSGR